MAKLGEYKSDSEIKPQTLYTRAYRERQRELGLTRKDPITKENWSKYMIRHIKSRSKKSNLDFNLTSEDLTLPEICPVLGIPIKVGIGQFRNQGSPSVDRFDNNKGYTKDNIRVISWRANRVKSDCSIEELEKVISYMKAGL